MPSEWDMRSRKAKCIRCKVVYTWKGAPTTNKAACPSCGEQLAQVRHPKDYSGKRWLEQVPLLQVPESRIKLPRLVR